MSDHIDRVVLSRTLGIPLFLLVMYLMFVFTINRLSALWDPRHRMECEGCGQIHYAEFPRQEFKDGLFKARLTALVAYMKNVCRASFSTIRKPVVF